jgi:hypothetical protein
MVTRPAAARRSAGYGAAGRGGSEGRGGVGGRGTKTLVAVGAVGAMVAAGCNLGATPVEYDVPGQRATTGDVNGDGDLDLLTWAPASHVPLTVRVAVLLGDGEGRFTPLVTSEPGELAAVALADLDGDGNDDRIDQVLVPVPIRPGSRPSRPSSTGVPRRATAASALPSRSAATRSGTRPGSASATSTATATPTSSLAGVMASVSAVSWSGWATAPATSAHPCPTARGRSAT